MDISGSSPSPISSSILPDTAMLDWGPTYLKEVKHASLGEGGVSTAALEFSAIFSTILMGWLSDKLGGRRGMISVLCMIPCSRPTWASSTVPPASCGSASACFGVIGFFVYPPVLLLVVSALDFTSKKAVGTAAGFLGLVRLSGPHGRRRRHRRAGPALRLDRGPPRGRRCDRPGHRLAFCLPGSSRRIERERPAATARCSRLYARRDQAA